MPRTESRLCGAAAALVAAAAAPVAHAAFSSLATGSQAVSSAGLDAPAGLAAACVPATSNVSLTWAPAASTAVTGYTVLRSSSSGGPYTPVGTTVGRLATTYTDSIGPLVRVVYVVRATRNSWVSASSGQAGLLVVALGICTPA